MLNKIRLISIVFFLLLASNCWAQQANIWYFGYNAGLNFNITPPIALLDGALVAREGCASISDNNGQILFYTDGATVYNRIHQPMPNGTGLLGAPSSAQAAIIVPQPGSENIYYIFTSDEGENDGANGYNYSIVDMSLDNGLGDITEKNHLLYAPSTEGLTALRNANGLDVWVVTKVQGTNEWRVYKIDCNGVQAMPVSSFAGITATGYVNSTVFRLKTSPDGKKLVIARAGLSEWELFDIDNSTGIISNPVSMHQNVPFGVEFSPDSKLVYISSNQIIQYDVTTSDYNTINNSATTVYTLLNSANTSVGSMQLGPDNKIYCSTGGTTQLGVINSPNTSGLACDYNHTQVDLKGRIGNGLPAIFPGLLTNKTADFNFVINSDCAKVDFTASSAISGNLTFNWDFGDGQTGTGQQISHTYAPNALNLNKVKLTVVSIYPCYATITKDVNLKRSIPAAAFEADFTCGNSTVKLTDKSTVSGTTISGWHWDFGDGQDSHDPSPNHTYATYGNYTITLSVTSAGTCNGTNQRQMTVPIEAKPVAAFNNTPTCVGKQVSFTDASTIQSGTITGWNWVFTDGASFDQNPVKTYNATGDYRVKMVAESATGCRSDTLFKTITVNNNPVASFTVADTCFTQSALFQGNVTVTNGSIADWEWEINNIIITGLSSPSYSFPNPGSYPVKFTARSSTGCISDVFARTISIRPKPVAGFTVQDGCTDTPLRIVNSSSVDVGTVSSGIWNFGNGDIRQSYIPHYTYSAPGTYNIQYNAVSDAGCISDLVTKTVLVESVPVTDFSFANTCVGKPINFANLSSNNSGAITGIRWTFGNGDVSTEISPVYTYNLYGEYPVTLINTTQNGCSSGNTKYVTIAKTIIDAGNDTLATIGQPFQLRVAGAASYTWQPATYLNDPFSATPVATLQNNMTYYITGVTAQGCIGYDTLHIKAYKGPSVYAPNAFTPNGNHKVFRPVLVGINELIGFSVYNRWGQLLFFTKEMNKGWDGKSNGSDQPAGTYVWIIQARDYLGKVHQEKGTVNIIR